MFVWLWLGLVFLEPVLVLTCGRQGTSRGRSPPALAALAVGPLRSLLGGSSMCALGSLGYLALLYPLTVLLSFIVAVRSLFLTLTGRTVWKGRRLTKPL